MFKNQTLKLIEMKLKLARFLQFYKLSITRLLFIYLIIYLLFKINVLNYVLFISITTIYIILNLTSTLINQNKFNRYTSTIKDFYSRSYTLFWIIEIFLFLIFLYLLCVSPDFMNYWFKVFPIQLWKQKQILNSNLKIFFILGISSYLIFLNFYIYKNNNNYNKYIILVLLLVISYKLMINEFNLFIFTVQSMEFSYSGSDIIELNQENLLLPKTKTNGFLITNSVEREKIFKFFKDYLSILIIILKFWHILILSIANFKLIYYNISNQTFKSTSWLLFNFLLLFVFLCLNFTLYFKFFFVKIFEFYYYWNGLNYSLIFKKNIIIETLSTFCNDIFNHS